MVNSFLYAFQEFCGKDFREAVNYLLEFNGKRSRDSPTPRPKSVPQEEKPAFALPISNQDQRRVFAYLQKRGIAAQVIWGFIDSGLLYEDRLHHNCVFVGREVGGKPVFASKRGTYDLNGSGFKADAVGSDKSVAFRLPCDPTLDWVAVFEAPIDLMSFCTLHRQVRSNALNNAIDAVSKLPEGERFISLSAKCTNGMLMLHVENPFCGSLTMEDGLPRSPRDERYHGFGMKSMKRIAEKYDGTLSVQSENGIFGLDVLLLKP